MSTLIKALELASTEENKGFTFINKDSKESFLSFSELYDEVLKRAIGLETQGIEKGDKIALVIPEERDFIITFYGAILSGVIPVPLYPPVRPDRIDQYIDTMRHIIKTSCAKAIITTPIIKKFLPSKPKVITLKEIVHDKGRFTEHTIKEDDIAFIQFTSGSTAYPKGVMVTHKNLSININSFMQEGVNVHEEDIGVSWLPLYHDMGLIGCVIASIFYKLPMIFISPFLFIRRPVEWLKAITKYRATISFAPNFAYGLCARRVKDFDGLDLSSWRIAGCAAEPISYDTLKNFSIQFKRVGFSWTSFLSAYGLAEATLAVTFTRPGEGISYDKIIPSALYEQKKAIPTNEEGLTVVCCGTQFRGHNLLIKSEDKVLGEREVGEIVINGPSVMKGYYNNEEATKKVLKDGWLYTGDLGYLVDGKLYVCGRKKDTIIIRGKNYYPQDIEWAVSKINGVRRGNVVAFGVKNRDRESVVVVLESRAKKGEWGEIANNIKKTIIEKIGVRIDEIKIIPPGVLPKTTSGKLQRNKTKELFESNNLKKPSLLSRWKNYIKFLVS